MMSGRKINLIATILTFTFIIDLSKATSCIIEKNGQSGECKFINECPEVQIALRQRKERPQICNYNLRTVCCPIQAATQTSVRSTLSNERVSVRKCRKYGEYRYRQQSIQNPTLRQHSSIAKIPQCFHNAVPLTIASSEIVTDREFPHIALIGFGEGRDDDYECSGSLIAEQWILSAAYCMSTHSGPANFAKLGHIMRYDTTQNSYIFRIIERVQHPNYNSKFGDDNIALFKLERPATLNSYVIPICLPNADSLSLKSFIATGFGKIGPNEDSSDELMKAVIEQFNPHACNEYFEHSNKFSNNRFDSRKMICAGLSNTTYDVCNSESGESIQTYHNDVFCSYTIVGITSFGSVYCGLPGMPVVYTKVYNYLDWIESVVWTN